MRGRGDCGLFLLRTASTTESGRDPGTGAVPPRVEFSIYEELLLADAVATVLRCRNRMSITSPLHFLVFLFLTGNVR